MPGCLISMSGSNALVDGGLRWQAYLIIHLDSHTHLASFMRYPLVD